MVRAGAAYLAVAFGILQGADLVLPALGLGPRAFNALVLASLLGFPLAVGLAWTFDVTGSGIRRTTAPAPGEWVPVEDPWVRLKAALVGAGFVGIALAGVRLWRGPILDAAPGPVPVERPVLAVLPFQDLSPGADQEYFADGLHEELLHRLAFLRGLGLVSRTSVMHFRGSPATVGAIADSLGARYVLEGSVRRAADSVRVTVQLIDAADDQHLWSESYTRALSMEGLFDLQTTLATRLARSLGGTLVSGGREVTGRLPTRDLEAYHAFLRARHHWYQFTREGMAEAAADLQRALDADPEFGLAHGLLAMVYTVQNNMGLDVQGERFPLIREHAALALRYAPDEPQSHFAMSAVSYTVERNWDAALEHIQHALALDPEFQDARWAMAEWYGIVAGETEEALQIVAGVERLDPFSATAGNMRASILHFGRRYAESAEEYRKLHAIDPGNTTNGMNLVSNLALSGQMGEARALLDVLLPRVRSTYGPTLAVHLARVGRMDEARAVLDEYRARRAAGGAVAASRLAAAAVAVGALDDALTWLERSFEEEGGIYTLRDPLWDPLRNDPRFERLWARVHLPGAPVRVPGNGGAPPPT